MPWGNPTFGGNGGLVAPSIHSPGYTPGVTGWTLNKDGTFELGGGTFRGDIEVDGANGAMIEIIDNGGQPTMYFTPQTWTGAPAEIRAQLTGSPGPGAGEIAFKSPIHPSGTQSAEISLHSGSNANPDDTEIDIVAETIYLLADRIVGLNGTAPTTIPQMIANTAGWSTAASAAVAGTETVVLTGSNLTFLANHVYEIILECKYTCAAVAGRVATKLRKATAIGQLLGDFGRTYMDTATPDAYNGSGSVTFAVGGTNVTTTLVVTIQGLGANAATMVASPVRGFKIRDIGPDTDYALVPVLV